MSGCSGCSGIKDTNKPIIPKVNAQELIVKQSTNPKNKIKLRYYGAGMKRKQKSGCHSCGGSSTFSLVTTERIQFLSDDAKKGVFSQTFNAGNDYYVTEKQAEYLLNLTYTTPGGEIAHKFKEVE